MALGRQEVGLHLRETAETAEAAARCDHAMVGKARFIGPPHDLPDRARRPGPSGQPGDIPVRDDPARWNPAQHMKHFPGEDCWRGALGHDETVF